MGHVSAGDPSFKERVGATSLQGNSSPSSHKQSNSMCGGEREPEVEDTAHPNPTPAPLARVHMEGKSASSGSIWRESQFPQAGFGFPWATLLN